jgi:hypothetical protein
MERVDALLAAARAAGLALYVDGARLIVRGPRSAAPLAQALLAAKAAVLARLAPPLPSPGLGGMPGASDDPHEDTRPPLPPLVGERCAACGHLLLSYYSQTTGRCGRCAWEQEGRRPDAVR